MSRQERLVAMALAAAILAGLGLAVVYVLGGQPQLEGALLGVALGGLGAALVLWATRLLPDEQIVEERERGPSEDDERRDLGDALERTGGEIGRRRFLVRLLAGAAGALGLAAVFPIRSLGPSPGDSLLVTAWRRGLRLVDGDGAPVRADALEVGSVLTVFPEGHVGSADSVVVLVRVDPRDLRLAPDRTAWAPEGNVGYSKLCTHAGCPVGLYRSESSELLCPCHQSTFDVLRGAVPLFGPAARPLPQLPIEVDAEGFLVAGGDFPEPVGPGFWSR